MNIKIFRIKFHEFSKGDFSKIFLIISLYLSIALWPYELIIPTPVNMGLNQNLRLLHLCIFSSFFIFSYRYFKNKHLSISHLFEKRAIFFILFLIYHFIQFPFDQYEIIYETIFTTNRNIPSIRLVHFFIDMLISFWFFCMIISIPYNKTKLRQIIDIGLNFSAFILLFAILIHHFYFDSYYLTGTFMKDQFLAIGITSKNRIGFFLLIIYPFIYSRFVREKSFLSTMSFIVYTYAIIYTFSRMTLLAMVLSTICLAIFPSKRKYRSHFIILAVSSLVFCLIFQITPTSYLQLKKKGIDSWNLSQGIEINQDKSVWIKKKGSRIRYIEWGLIGGKETPVFGHGIASFKKNHQDLNKNNEIIRKPVSHNDYVQIFYELGFLGLFLFALVVFSSLFYGVKLALAHDDWVGEALFPSLLCMFFSMNMVNVYENYLVWIIFGLTLKLTLESNTKDCEIAR
jgi:hypothetical protein